VNHDGVFVLEIAARPIGGLCARALRFDADPARQAGASARMPPPESPITLEELLLRHAVGDTPARYTRESAASGVMMIPIPRRGVLRHVDGIDAARSVLHTVDVRITAKPDQMLIPLPEGSSYLGFIFARASAPQIVERSLRDAHTRLTFAIDPEFPILGAAQSRYNQGHG
jgi:hypothetical protein